ncbi:hypothetical protein C8E01_111123 [Pontibacter virosus]|uniref:Uncharacterized protein n=1 Tax=Pontibacter virosus TaxID=1765052 RepID=A0A2U1ASW3_9BACT|nr:hypothetical protein C8E01_111123 [Pontibacter virosus]
MIEVIDLVKSSVLKLVAFAFRCARSTTIDLIENFTFKLTVV